MFRRSALFAGLLPSDLVLFVLVLSAFVVSALVVSAAAFSQTSAAAGVPVTVTVTALGAHFKPAPDIPKRDVNVRSNGTLLRVTRWERAAATDGDLQLAILIDDNVPTSLIGNQLKDIANFINALPPDASVAVFYAQHGSAVASAPFGTERAKVAKSVRLTSGGAGDSPSVYLSLDDLAAHWPQRQSARREVLLIGSGDDALHPGSQDPYFDAALEKVQRAGIEVHSMYVGSTRYGLSFRGDISQGKLTQVASDTGGQPFVDLPSAPVSFAPYLDQLTAALQNQYTLTVLMEPSKKKAGELRPLQIKTEEHNVKLSAPKVVFVPAS